MSRARIPTYADFHLLVGCAQVGPGISAMAAGRFSTCGGEGGSRVLSQMTIAL